MLATSEDFFASLVTYCALQTCVWVHFSSREHRKLVESWLVT